MAFYVKDHNRAKSDTQSSQNSLKMVVWFIIQDKMWLIFPLNYAEYAAEGTINSVLQSIDKTDNV